jgi:hypothetical protein
VSFVRSKAEPFPTFGYAPVDLYGGAILSYQHILAQAL